MSLTACACAFQPGDTAQPPSSLSEAASRALIEIQAKRLHDRKSTQRQLVAKFVQATAAAFEVKNTSFASDPLVGCLLHDDIILITYDKMKFFGRRTVQKKLNHGARPSHRLLTQETADKLSTWSLMSPPLALFGTAHYSSMTYRHVLRRLPCAIYTCIAIIILGIVLPLFILQ